MAESRLDRLYVLLGRRIRERRKAIGMTQDGLSKKVGLSRTSVTNLESGRQRPPLHLLDLVASALEIDLRELIPPAAELAGRREAIPVMTNGKPVEAPEQTANFIRSALTSG